MSRATDLLRERLVALIDPICEAHGVELVDVRHLGEPGGAVIRVIIDREPTGELDGSGVSLDDCTRVSRDVSTALDVHDEDLPKGRYRLEVSSPGLERPLVRLRDFERFRGRDIRLKTRAPIDRRRRFQGKLVDVVDGAIALEQDGTVLNIPHDEIAQATLVYRFST